MTFPRFLCVTCLLFLLNRPALGTVDPVLEDALDRLPPGGELDVTMTGGDRFLGYYSGIESGRLLVRTTGAQGTTAAPDKLLLEDILRLRVSCSSTRKGFNIGLTTGAVTTGSLSLLWGIALTSLDEGDDSFADVLGFTMAGTVIGGLALGTLGAGIGAVSSHWETVYESPLAPPLEDLPVSSPSRLGLGFGVASGHSAQVQDTSVGICGRFDIQMPLSGRFTLGPEIGYYDISGEGTVSTYGYTHAGSFSQVVTFGLVTTWQSRRRGWAPFLMAGGGYYVGGEGFLGFSFGGGLRYRTADRQEFRLEFRDHVNIWDSDEEQDLLPDYFLTLGAALSFDL